uniref:Fibronectin type-III domain-containing protein n=1 Tax=Ascaris lumbricoides TaxID=6252 RepID=A0A9J2PKP5_ASCLU
MCGIMQSSVCRFTELTPGQFGLTKQLVLRIALPHVSLLVVAVGYAILGSWVLTAIKYRDGTSEVIDELERAKKSFFAQLLRIRSQSTRKIDSERFFVNFVDSLYDIYIKYPKSPAVAKSIESGVPYVDDDPMSNVTWNLFFAATTLTSIGYGANAPDSVIGRLFIFLYILFGIPLYLITMADLLNGNKSALQAKFCTEGMNRTYTEFLKFRYNMHRNYRRWKSGRQRRDSVAIGEVIIAGGEDEVKHLCVFLVASFVTTKWNSFFKFQVAEFIWTHLENTKFVEVPFLLIYVSLFLYVLVATYLISSIEGWSNYDGFYFLMMSVLTIGFGDLVPRNQTFILVTLFIILVGLVLMTTTIDVVGAYYIDRLHFFGRRLETQDPLAWLKAVQQKHYQSMNNILSSRGDADSNNAIKLPDPPQSPRGIIAMNATAESVLLKWEPPLYVDEGRRYWYTLSYKTRTPQGINNPLTVIDFINTPSYEVQGLRSFTLYEFSVVTTTRYGSSKPAKCQEYTEPCTVPQSLRLDASYVIQFTQEPAPQFHYWKRYRCGNSKRFTITDLAPDTRYIMCVSAEHNFGLAAMSKSLRFKTKQWWCDDEGSSQVIPPFIPLHAMDTASSDAASTASAIR